MVHAEENHHVRRLHEGARGVQARAAKDAQHAVAQRVALVDNALGVKLRHDGRVERLGEAHVGALRRLLQCVCGRGRRELQGRLVADGDDDAQGGVREGARGLVDARVAGLVLEVCHVAQLAVQGREGHLLGLQVHRHRQVDSRLLADGHGDGVAQHGGHGVLGHDHLGEGQPRGAEELLLVDGLELGEVHRARRLHARDGEHRHSVLERVDESGGQV
mmetsp:Transcript_15689/g.42141  ORF Transcript_15689/g.42141 Transcript_15689/m.42141 type:complete len:218 (+) Transcript_15689:2487-3140(+)